MNFSFEGEKITVTENGKVVYSRKLMTEEELDQDYPEEYTDKSIHLSLEERVSFHLDELVYFSEGLEKLPSKTRIRVVMQRSKEAEKQWLTSIRSGKVTSFSF